MSSTVAEIRVTECLVEASEDSLSSSLALLHELSLFNLLWSKAAEAVERVDNRINKGNWSTNGDRFHEQVVKKSEEFKSLSTGERLLQTIGELQKLMGVAPRDLCTVLDLYEAAEDIGNAAVNTLRQDKHANFNGDSVSSMIEFQITKIFGGLSVRMEELSSTQQQSLVDRVREFLQSLPADQQRFIVDKLGAQDLSESAIRQAIASGAMWAAFAAAVQVFGFAFYTTAAHLLAIVSLHLLPFGAYVGLSSTIAVLSSPWMLPIFAGFGVWYYNRKNRKLRQSLAPLIVTSLCFSGMEMRARLPGQQQATVDEALSLWATARNIRDGKRNVALAAKASRGAAENDLAATRTQLAGARRAKANAVAKRAAADKELVSIVDASIPAIREGRWASSLVPVAVRIGNIEAELDRARARRDSQKGFWGVIKGGMKYAFESLDWNAALLSVKESLVHEVKSSWKTSGSSYPPSAQSILRNMEEGASEIISAEAEIGRLTAQEQEQSKRLSQASAALVDAERDRSTSEQRYYGLGTV